MNIGSLHLFLGPMFSGKTTRLIQEYTKRKHIQENIIAINYAGDKRYDETQLSTHDKIMIPCIQCYMLKDVMEVESICNSTTIFINEGQFFQDIYETVMDWVEKQGKCVYIFALDGDYNRCFFGDMYRLIPVSDTIEKLSGFCMRCKNGTPALFSHRISSEIQQISIGCDYIPLCRKCYLENKKVI
jgi:thymidine kinase